MSEWVWVSEWMSKWASESEWVNNWVGWWVSEWISEWVSKEASKWVPAHQAVSLSFSQPASQPASQSVRNLVSLQPTLLYRTHIYSLGVQLKLALQLKLLLDVTSYTNMLPYLYIAATFTTKNWLRGKKVFTQQIRHGEKSVSYHLHSRKIHQVNKYVSCYIRLKNRPRIHNGQHLLPSKLTDDTSK